MPLHRLTHIVMGVPNVEQTAAYYTEFGLIPADAAGGPAAAGRRRADGRAAHLRHRRRRRAAARIVGSDRAVWCGSASASTTPMTSTGSPPALAALGVPVARGEGCVTAADPGTRVDRPGRGRPPGRAGADAGARLQRPGRRPSGPTRARPASCASSPCGPASSAMSCSAPPTRRPRSGSSPRASGSRSATRCRTSPRSCAAPPTITTSWSSRRRSRSCTTPPGRSTTSTRSAAAPSAMLAGDPDRHIWGLGRHYIGSNFFWYLQGPGRQLLRVLLRPGLHRRRRAVDAGGVGGRAGAVGLGAAAAPVVPRPGGPGRADGRRAPALVTGTVSPIWRPDPDRRGQLRHRPVRPVRHRPDRSRVRRVPRPVALVGRPPRGVLGRGLGLLRPGGGRQPRGGADRRRHAGGALVPRHPAQLRRARPAAPAGRRRRGGGHGRQRGRDHPSRPPGRSSAPRSPRSPTGSAAAGVGRGDRVVGYLPDSTPALVAFLATASVGAIWSACAQDYGAGGAAARFAQLEPVVLFAADGYPWNGKVHDRRGRGGGAAAGAAHPARHRPCHQRRPVRPGWKRHPAAQPPG